MQKITTILWAFLLCGLMMLHCEKIQAQIKANFTISPDTVCANLLDSFSNTTTGGALPYTYFWDYGNSKISTSMTGYANYSSAGTYTIKLRVTDSKGNKDSITKTITVLGFPIADYAAYVAHCTIVIFNANEDSLTPTSISNYLIVGEGPGGLPPLHINDQTGSIDYVRSGTYHYAIVVTGANGCKTIYNDSIRVPSPPTLDFNPDTSVCLNSTITINATPKHGTPPFSILFGLIDTSTIKAIIIKDTIFPIYIIDAKGCYLFDTLNINTFPLPNAHWTLNDKIDSVEFKAQNIGLRDSSYEWSFLYDHNLKSIRVYGPVIGLVFPTDSIYSIELLVTDKNGCRSYFDSSVNVAKLGFGPYITDNLSIDIYPNPFQSSASVRYRLTQKTNVGIELYDAMGKLIETLTNEIHSPGTYQFDINADKYRLTSGIYLLKIITDDGFVSRNILKL